MTLITTPHSQEVCFSVNFTVVGNTIQLWLCPKVVLASANIPKVQGVRRMMLFLWNGCPTLFESGSTYANFSHMQKNEIENLSYTAHKNQLKWLKNLNVKPELIQLLEENKGEKLLDVWLGNDFLDMTQKVQTTKTKRKGNLWDRRKYSYIIYMTRGKYTKYIQNS